MSLTTFSKNAILLLAQSVPIAILRKEVLPKRTTHDSRAIQDGPGRSWTVDGGAALGSKRFGMVKDSLWQWVPKATCRVTPTVLREGRPHEFDLSIYNTRA
ncbi:MAG TPA: hypothetical protein DDX19_10505 [Rhodopirellula baltica]|nr:hypothetical protein [Rhodopirellula baltica]